MLTPNRKKLVDKYRNQINLMRCFQSILFVVCLAAVAVMYFKLPVDGFQRMAAMTMIIYAAIQLAAAAFTAHLVRMREIASGAETGCWYGD